MDTRGSQRPIIRIWGNRAYSIFMAGGVPSYLTSWMQRVGVGWLAWDLTHSPVWLGLVAAGDLGPMVIMAPFAGAITDRHDPLIQLRIAQALLLAQAIGLAVFMMAGWMSVEILLGFSLLSGVIYPFFQTSRHLVVPATVPRRDFATAVALDSALFQGMRFVGPSVAGLLIPVTGVQGTFIAHALGCLWYLVALCILTLPVPERKSRRDPDIFRDIAESLVYVRGHMGIWPLLVLLTAASVLFRPMQDMLPGFAGDVFSSDATGLAWLASATGVGAMASAAWIATRGRLAGLSGIMFVGYFLVIAGTFAFVATRDLRVGVIFAAVTGFFLNSMSTSTQALVQSAVSNDMRGRVMALYALVWRGMPAIGAIVLGFLADHIGLRATFAVSAVVGIGCGLLLLPRYRQIAAAAERPHADTKAAD